MLVGKIKPNSAIQKFDGYVDKAATSKKMAFDIFQKGDSVFLTGDVLVMDKYGNMRFKDRTGDTFRWKGENVSTAECEADLAKVLKHHHTVAVYGVDIPGTEGKAGMACIVDPDNTVDIEEFYQGVVSSVVSYARPIFVRVTKSVTITGTHKISNVNLHKAGYNIDSFEDSVYFLNKKGYTKMDSELYQNILSGNVRV
jgi:solute carrier family 27 fatty acid transporter 1/4